MMFCATESEQIDMLAMQSDMTEFVTGIKKFVISPTAAGSSEAVNILDYTQKLLSVWERVIDQGWRHI